MTFVSYCGILSRFMFMSITPDFIGHPVPSFIIIADFFANNLHISNFITTFAQSFAQNERK